MRTSDSLSSAHDILMSCVLTAIVSSLPLEDPNVDKLQAAIDRLGTICSMEVDDTTKRAAVFWALGEAIDGFPASLVGSGRRFIDAIDVDEVFEVSDPRPASETLRCTLWLFSDCLLITKRPRGDRTGKSLAGLDNPDRVVQLYQTAHLSSSQATLLGSPKRLRKGVLGSRGLVNLCEMVAVDLGTSGTGDGVEHEFGLLLDDPPNDQSSRWNGRPARRYVVAGTTMPEQRGREKESFLASFGETLLQQKLKDGASATYRGAVRQSAEADAGEVYWALWQRRTYESLKGAQKVRLLSPPVGPTTHRPHLAGQTRVAPRRERACWRAHDCGPAAEPSGPRDAARQVGPVLLRGVVKGFERGDAGDDPDRPHPVCHRRPWCVITFLHPQL